MRMWILIGTLVLIPLAFFVGRITSSGEGERPDGGGPIYVGGSGDVFRVPTAETECVVSAEGGSPNLICNHIPQHHHEVYFYRDDILVLRNGDPDAPPVFTARGKP